jgi:hypothetical protein
MLRLADRLVTVLLALGALGHAFGSLRVYAAGSSPLVWSEAGALCAALLAALNWLRAGRPQDAALAWICVVGCVAWVAIALAFGASVGSMADPRAVYHAAVAAVLAAFSLRTALGRAG